MRRRAAGLVRVLQPSPFFVWRALPPEVSRSSVPNWQGRLRWFRHAATQGTGILSVQRKWLEAAGPPRTGQRLPARIWDLSGLRGSATLSSCIARRAASSRGQAGRHAIAPGLLAHRQLKIVVGAWVGDGVREGLPKGYLGDAAVRDRAGRAKPPLPARGSKSVPGTSAGAGRPPRRPGGLAASMPA
jgi:hypothetical protein